MKRKTFTALTALLTLLLAASVTVSALRDDSQGDYAKLMYGGVTDYYDLSEKNESVTVGGVTIAFDKGRVWVERSDCPDKVCVKSGVLESTGDTAVCLPNGVVLTVIGREQFAQESKNERALYSESFIDTFDTVVTLSAYARSKEEFDAYFKTFHSRFEQMSREFDAFYEYEGISNICTINKCAGKETVVVSQELADALGEIRAVCGGTGGCTDITYGAVTSLWKRYINEETGLPDSESVTEALSHCGGQTLKIDGTSVLLTDKEARLDAGACAKGYTAQVAADELVRSGLESFCINAGGNIVARGGQEGADGWKIGVENPFGTNAHTALVTDGCVVTSGNYRRYREENGVRYSHLVDLKTGYPSQYFASVSVICDDSTEGDAYSTALFCMDLESGKRFAEQKNISVIWITNDGEVIKKLAR